MIVTKIKFNLGRIKITGPSFSSKQMALLGQEGLKSVRERVLKGIGADDTPMPRLSGKAYAIRNKNGVFVRKGPPYEMWKVNHGLNPWRDLVGPGIGGHMLENLSVRSANETQVKIALTQTKARQKALANEKRAPWLWWSENDQNRILEYAKKVFDANVEIIAKQIRRARKAA